MYIFVGREKYFEIGDFSFTNVAVTKVEMLTINKTNPKAILPCLLSRREARKTTKTRIFEPFLKHK